jgi:hypothetical protein
VSAEHRLDVRRRRRTVNLRSPPPLGVLAECHLARARVDVLPGHHGRRDLVEPPLSVDLPREVAGVLAAAGIAVAGAPATVRALRDTGHGYLPSSAWRPGRPYLSRALRIHAFAVDLGS